MDSGVAVPGEQVAVGWPAGVICSDLFAAPRGLGRRSARPHAEFTRTFRVLYGHPGGPRRIDANMQKRPQPLAAVNEAPLPPDRAFVVQLRAQGDAGGELFAGRVEHLTSGAAERFDSAEGLIRFVTRVLASAAASTPGGAGQAERSSTEEEP
jgi:hypothetical protein